jgi:hypothetical protein
LDLQLPRFFLDFSKLSIYFSWAELGIWVYFILEISVTWGPSVSRVLAVFTLLLAEQGGAARRHWRGYKAVIRTGYLMPLASPRTPTPTAPPTLPPFRQLRPKVTIASVR